MKKKIWIPILIASVLLLAFLFVPIPMKPLEDGGTQIYASLTYKIVDWNREYENDVYTPTKVYFGKQAWLSVDELWAQEEPNLSHSMRALVWAMSQETIWLEPLYGEWERKTARDFEIDLQTLDGFDAERGDLIEVFYDGEIHKTEDGRETVIPLSWRRITAQYDQEYEGEWLDQEAAEEPSGMRLDRLLITQIYVNCFFVQDTYGSEEYVIKMNGRIGDQWCVGDVVECTYKNLRCDPTSLRAEADAKSIQAYEEDLCAKPVIYLYPEAETEVTVKLTVDGELTCTYPSYEDGWTVTAAPDGTLTDADGKVYNYLYWEALSSTPFDFSRGFCVKGEDTAEFLEVALAQLGLNRREANEFIVYWLPLMEVNEYNVIAFQTDVYTDSAKLEISPTPDTLIRVFMAWYGTDTPVDLPEQELTAPEREGFTVIEWGGSRVSA